MKGDTAIYINNFYNYINIYLNAVTGLQAYPLPVYQYVKLHSKLQENFVPNFSHPYYDWNEQTYTSLGHSLLVSLKNYTCIKSPMAPQYYKVVTTHAH